MLAGADRNDILQLDAIDVYLAELAALHVFPHHERRHEVGSISGNDGRDRFVQAVELQRDGGAKARCGCGIRQITFLALSFPPPA